MRVRSSLQRAQVGVSQNWGVLPRIRTIVYWGLELGPPILGNYQVSMLFLYFQSPPDAPSEACGVFIGLGSSGALRFLTSGVREILRVVNLGLGIVRVLLFRVS